MMLLYLVNVVRAFMPLSVIAGMLLAFWRPRYGKKATAAIIVSLSAGLPAAALIYLISFRYETVTAARIWLDLGFIAAAITQTGTLLLRNKQATAIQAVRLGAAGLLTIALAASAMFSFLDFVTAHALTAITVLNTDLIVNIGGILLGACLVTFLVPLTSSLTEKTGRPVVAALLLIAVALLAIPAFSDGLLGLMRLEMAEVTSARLSFVSKATKYASLIPYIHVFMIAVLSLVYFAKRTAPVPDDLFGMERAERRKVRGRAQFELRWLKSAVASIGVILAILLSYDLYASRPVRISPPVRLIPDPAGLIKIRIDDVKDGNLHRYSYVTDDGHVVRFFLINRFKGQSRIGVVYDACMLCGDMGYIKEKNEVICIACNVRIFTPSIGKAGGCNPVPLKHAVDGEYIVVKAEELDNGARYFSEIVSIRVKDPVTGKELDNLKAPYRYEYNGRSYFFESEASEEKFRTSPETYVGEQRPRYERVQGYQEM